MSGLLGRSGSPPLSTRIAERIREAIVDARFAFGEALSEENLAEAFDVSRTPIREALSLLELEGLVTIVPKSGTYIFTPTSDDIAELCDYRAGLERLALDLALVRDRTGLRDALAGVVAEMEPAVSANDMRRYGRLDQRYHLMIVEQAGNRYLERGYALILGRVSALRTQLAVHATAEPAASMTDHRGFVDLLEQRADDELRDRLTAHILRTKQHYLDAFGEGHGASAAAAGRQRRRTRP